MGIRQLKMFSILSCSSPAKNDKHATYILKQTSTIFKRRIQIWVQCLIYHCLFVSVWLRFCLLLLFSETESHSVLILCYPGWFKHHKVLLPQPTKYWDYRHEPPSWLGQEDNDKVILLWHRIASNSWSSCISPLSARITEGGHHTQP